MLKQGSEDSISLNYDEMKTLNEIDSNRKKEIIKVSETVSKRFDKLIELLKDKKN